MVYSRRGALLALGSVAVASGCTDTSDEPETTDDNSVSDTNNEENDSQTEIADVTVGSDDHTLENGLLSITIRYITNTVSEIDPPDSTARSAASGQKFLVVRAEVTVESELTENIDVYGSVVGLEADGIIYDGRSIRNLPGLTQTVTPGTTYDAWIQYEIPEDVTEATLVATNPRNWFDYSVELTFEQDDSLSATLPE